MITLLQRFRRGNYAEHGHKRFVARRVGAAMQFTSEEMLDSKRGWDEDEYASQVPMQAADCKVAFDPSNRAYAGRAVEPRRLRRGVARGRQGGARRSSPLRSFGGAGGTDLGTGFWVLAGRD